VILAEPEADLISLSEAARRLGVDRRTVSDLIDLWGLPSRNLRWARLINPQTYAALRERLRIDRGP
jgi:hypothetical protein